MTLALDVLTLQCYAAGAAGSGRLDCMEAGPIGRLTAGYSDDGSTRSHEEGKSSPSQVLAAAVTQKISSNNDCPLAACIKTLLCDGIISDRTSGTADDRCRIANENIVMFSWMSWYSE